MNRTAFKIAASTVMMALTMTSVAAPSGAMRRNGPVRANSPTDREARQAGLGGEVVCQVW